MAEPFIFHFKLHPSGEPEAMYLADLFVGCSVCQHEQIQRYYHTLSLHRLDAERLVELASNLGQKTNFGCENCGTDFNKKDVIATTLTFGFADDSGIVMGFYRDNILRFKLHKNRRLDPQVLPGFDLPPVDELEYLEEKFERVVNPKILWMELFESFAEDPKEGAWGIAAPGYYLLVHENEGEHQELLNTLSNDDDFIIALDNFPSALPLKNEDSLYAPMTTWLAVDTLSALENEDLFATAIIPRKPLIAMIKLAFDTAKIKYIFENDRFSEIKTPTGVVFDSDISIISVAERAAFTGLTPGEAARLTAEEVVGTLLRIWR